MAQPKEFEQAFVVSELLKTGLSREMLARCMSLIEMGVNPEGLAMVLADLNAK